MRTSWWKWHYLRIRTYPYAVRTVLSSIEESTVKTPVTAKPVASIHHPPQHHAPQERSTHCHARVPAASLLLSVLRLLVHGARAVSLLQHLLLLLLDDHMLLLQYLLMLRALHDGSRHGDHLARLLDCRRLNGGRSRRDLLRAYFHGIVAVHELAEIEPSISVYVIRAEKSCYFRRRDPQCHAHVRKLTDLDEPVSVCVVLRKIGPCLVFQRGGRVDATVHLRKLRRLLLRRSLCGRQLERHSHLVAGPGARRACRLKALPCFK